MRMAGRGFCFIASSVCGGHRVPLDCEGIAVGRAWRLNGHSSHGTHLIAAKVTRATMQKTFNPSSPYLRLFMGTSR